MRAIPGGMLKGRIQRVSDLEMAAIKAAVEAGHRDREPGRPDPRAPDRGVPQEGEALRRHLPALPRARLPPAGAAPAGRRALGLRPGDTVVDIACGTGLNFPLLEEAIGPDGRIVGVDLTDAMLAQAQRRIESERLEQRQPRAGRRRRVRLPGRGRRDPVDVRPDAGARVRRRSSPTARRPSRKAGGGPCWISRSPTARLGG